MYVCNVYMVWLYLYYLQLILKCEMTLSGAALHRHPHALDGNEHPRTRISALRPHHRTLYRRNYEPTRENHGEKFCTRRLDELSLPDIQTRERQELRRASLCAQVGVEPERALPHSQDIPDCPETLPGHVLAGIHGVERRKECDFR